MVLVVCFLNNSMYLNDFYNVQTTLCLKREILSDCSLCVLFKMYSKYMKMMLFPHEEVLFFWKTAVKFVSVWITESLHSRM